MEFGHDGTKVCQRSNGLERRRARWPRDAAERTKNQGGFYDGQRHALVKKTARQPLIGGAGAKRSIGYSIQTPYIRSVDGDQTPLPLTGAYSLENPWPDGLIVPYGNKLGIGTNVGGGVSYDCSNRPIPRTFQWSYTLERQLPWSMVLEVSYVGSLTNKEVVTTQLSDMSQSDYEAAFKNPNFYNASLTNPWYGIIPNNQPLGASPTISRRELLRRIPQFNSVTSNINPWGRVYYHGLQTRFEKRMLGQRAKTGALTWVMAYTWSKQMEKVIRNQYNFEWYKDWLGSVVTGNDRTHNFQLAGIWDLPVGKGRAFFNQMNKAADGVLGGWNLNYTASYQTGVPLGAWTGWDYTCGDPAKGTRDEFNWVDKTRSCYRQLQPFEQTQLMPRFHQIRGHTAPQVDLTLAKKINFRERYQLEIRCEAFNATNTPLRGDPGLGNPSDSQFAVLPVQQLNFPRNIQLGMRLRF